MERVVVVQSPGHLFEVVPIFYQAANKLGYFDRFIIATDYPKPYGLGSNVDLVQLPRDLGRAENFRRALERVTTDLCVVMCDDHVLTTDTLNLDQYYKLMQQYPEIGRIELGPASPNYDKYLRKSGEKRIKHPSSLFEPYQRGYRFYTNFQPSLWRTEAFHRSLKGDANRNKLELAVANNARADQSFISGFIHERPMPYLNFYASCKVHTADPRYNRQQNFPHYREEFARHAKEHGLKLDPEKNVFVKRKAAGICASVPLAVYLENPDNEDVLRQYSTSTTGIAGLVGRLKSKLKDAYHAVR